MPTGWIWAETEGIELTEEISACPLCGSEETTPLYTDLPDVNLRTDGLWSIARCCTCGGGFLSVRYTREAIHRAYAGGYYTHLAEDTAPSLSAEPGLAGALKRGCLNRCFGYRLPNAHPLGAAALRMKPLSRLYLERRIRSLRCVVGGTVLDVGCGSGAFLDDMRALGWRSVGLEPDPNAARLARSRGAEVWEGTVETVSAPTALFDAVTMNHSLEHTHDPAAVIRTLCGWLKPGGVLWVAVPNFLSGLHRHYGRHWVALDPPRHLVHFTPQALRQLLEGAGLHVEWSSTVLPAEWTCFASEMVAAGGSPFRDPLEKTETAWQLAQKFDRSARADLSTADEIVMIGTRPQH